VTCDRCGAARDDDGACVTCARADRQRAQALGAAEAAEAAREAAEAARAISDELEREARRRGEPDDPEA